MPSYLIIVFLLLTVHAFGQEVIPYPDNSPPSEGFLEMGIPAIDQIWGEEEYKTAFIVLDQIYEIDKFSLPRMDSEFSGAIFKRLTALENFDFLNDQSINIGKRIIAFEHIKEFPARILLYYIENFEENERFGAEVLEGLFLAAYVYQAGMEVHAELELQLGERANQGQFRSGLERLQMAFNDRLGLVLQVFESDMHRYSERDVLTFANKLYFLLPKISNSAYRKQLKFRLKALENSYLSPQIHQVLKEIRQEL